MPSETSTTKVSLSSKTTESRCLAIANLPDTATEETVKECFKRYGRVLSVRIDDQRYGFVAFLDVRTASKAHNAENLLDEQRLRTAFHDGSTLVPKALLEPLPPPATASVQASSSSSSNASAEQPSPLTSTVIDPSFASSPNTPTVTTSSTSKLMNGDREKRSSRTHASPDDNVRHQVVPVKRDSDSSGSKRKNTSTNISKTSNSSHPTVQKPSHRKHENSSSSSSSSSSSESERSSEDSVSCKPQRRKVTKNHSSLNESMGRTKILKVYHLPSKATKDFLRESLWNLFVDYKKAGRLLTVKIDGEHESRHALLTFRKAEDVDKASTFATGKLINGTRLKAEPYDASAPDNEECDPVKRSTCPDPDIDEYSVKATRTLYIGNLQSEISYNELREAYSAYGDIIELEIKRQTQSQHQLPFAFVQYADIKSVVKAMKAFESKVNRDHSIKLGFGKSQPTNVLWLDDLSLNTTESALRTSIIRITTLPTDQVLDIYIDNRNSQKSQTAQCLIYFSDTRAAQEAINLIRGKKIDSRKIQVDFASKVFVTRFSDIIEETSHKKNYPVYPPDPSAYHAESRPVTKRNITTREIVPEPIQAFEAPSARTNSGDRWANAYNNSNRLPHKNDARHSSDRRHSKEYAKGTSNSLIPIPSGDNGTITSLSLTSRRHRLSTSSKDSLSNNVSSGRHAHRGTRPRRHASSTTSLSSRSSSSSSHSSTSTNSVERRSTSHQKNSNSKHASKSSKKPLKASSTTNAKASTKKASSNKEPSIKSSHRSRPSKSEKEEEPSTATSNTQQQQQQPDIIILPSLSLGEQIESIKKDPSPAKPPSAIQSSASPKAASKNTERVFDWLMQNHHQDSNSSMGLDQNDDEDNPIKSKLDDDSLENVSDEQTSKNSPPIPNNNSASSATMPLSASAGLGKNAKNDKAAALSSSYRLQPIRAGGKRDEQSDNSLTANDLPLSSSPPPPPPPPPASAPVPPIPSAQPTPSTPTPSIATPVSAPPTTPVPVTKDDSEQNANPRRVNRTKNLLVTTQTKKIPLECQASYDQLDVRLKSYPSLFNDHIESIRLPFPQFAFEHIKTSATASNVLVVLNPKAHLKHSSLGLNNPSTTTKHETSIDPNNNTSAVTNSNDDDLSTARIPLDERIRLLDKHMHELNHGPQKSATSSSSSSSSSSLSPATLIEQQNLKSSNAVTIGSAGVKSVNDLALSLSSSTPQATLNQYIQAARAALSAQPATAAKTPLAIPSNTPFSFPVTSVPSLGANRSLSVTSPSPVNIASVLVTPPPPPLPPPPPFPSLQRLPDPTSHSILNFHAALAAQTQMAAVGKYNPLQFPATLHPPPPPVPASLISPSLAVAPTNSAPAPPTNNLTSPLTISRPLPPPPPPALSLPHRSASTDLLSPSLPTTPSNSSFPEPTPSSPSTSSAKILERLGPSAKFKRKLIPPPLAVVTTPMTPTSLKESPLLPSPEPTSASSTGSNAHHSPVPASSPVLQHQLSNSSSGLKSILKQRSLSNSSSASPNNERKSPTNERKSSTNYVSPLASSESRSTAPNVSTNNRSASIDSTTKRTPPTTPIPMKKKPANQQDSHVFSNDIDERQAEEKKSTWRAPPSKPTDASSNIKKQVLDKIPKKASAITQKSTVAEPVKSTATPTSKPTKSTKPISNTPIGSKMPQLTLERIDTKSLKNPADSSEKFTPKLSKIKRVKVIQSDSDTEKKPVSASSNLQKTKKPSLNNEITKRKQLHQQKPTMLKKHPLVTTKSKPVTPVKKSSMGEHHSSASEMDEKRTESTATHSDQDLVSSDTDEKQHSTKKRPKSTTKSNNNEKSGKKFNSRDMKLSSSMYDIVKKRARSEQTRHSSLSTSEDHLSDDNSDEDNNHRHRHRHADKHDSDDDDDNDDEDNRKDRDDSDEEEEEKEEEEEEDEQPVSNRSKPPASKRHNFIEDSSDSDHDRSSKSKTKSALVFDNNIFDDEDSDEKSKSINRKKKVEPESKASVKKSILKTNNEQPKKDPPSKTHDEQTAAKKKISITKTTEKKKPTINTTKTISKIIKSNNAAQKRPSTDDTNEPAKKLKTDGEKSKAKPVEEPILKVEPEPTTPEKPAIVITSPAKESPSTATKTDLLSNHAVSDVIPPTTPSKFGIVFASHRRQSTATTPPSTAIRTQSTETSTSHETSKNDDEEMDDDSESTAVNNHTATPTKTDSIASNANTLKPPANAAQPPLSDDETLNPETMQLSDLIGASRREGPEPVKARSATKGLAKGKRPAKKETISNKRQQVKATTKPVEGSTSKEKVAEPSIVPLVSVEPAAKVTSQAKRLSTAESTTTPSTNATKQPKRLRTNTGDSAMPVKTEPIEQPPPVWPSVPVKEEPGALIIPPVVPEPKEVPVPTVEPTPPPVAAAAAVRIPMEIDPIVPTPVLPATQSPSSTSAETENAIKAVYPSIQIAAPTIAKLSNPEKPVPIIASISKETLPIVEHQPTPIVPAHVPIKPPLTSAAFNETVEETLSAVNSLLMLNNNPPNPSGDHQALKGTSRVAPTISKPVYSFVASLPSPTNQPSRSAPTPTTNISTPTSQPTDLITLVSNIVSSSNLNGEKQPTLHTLPARSHIEEVIDDVAKGGLTSSTTTTATTNSAVATTPPTPMAVAESTASMVETNSISTVTSSSKATPIPHILRDVMKTPCLTSSNSTPPTTTSTATVTSETLNLFDSHRRATSPLKTTTTASAIATTTTSTNVSTTVASSTPVVPVVVRPNASKNPTSHKRSATPKTEASSPMLHPFPHMLPSDSSLFAAATAAAHHSNFPFSLFGPMPSSSPNSNVNASSNLLSSPLVSSSPPLSTRIPATSSASSSVSGHLVNNPFLNTIMSGQQPPPLATNASHSHEKASRRDSATKSQGTSSSSSSRSTPIQQTVPVPIPLTIPSSSSGTINNVAAHQQQQQRQQPSPLLSTLDAAAAAMRQQSSPLPPFLGPESVVPFRNVYAEASELYGPPGGLFPSPNMAYAAAHQMFNVIGMTGNHHPSAAAFAAELYSNADSYFRLNPPASELSRDPYNVQWQGNLILKNDQAYVKTQLVAGSPQIARASMNYWNSDSLCSNPTGLSPASHHNLRISQRMRLEQSQLEGVQKRMQMDNDHCILIAEPNGSTPDEIRMQQNNLKNGVIRYFDEKKAAGIVNVLLPGASQPAYVVHIFPPCPFASEILQRRAPDTYRCVVQNKLEQIYLLIVITSTVQ